MHRFSLEFLFFIGALFYFPAIASAQGFYNVATNDLKTGVNIHFLAGEGDQLDSIKAAGFSFVRVDLSWQLTEPTVGKYSWTNFDILLNDLKARNLAALIILGYSNSNYAATGEDGKAKPPTSDFQIHAYSAWAASAAVRYRKHNVAWEIWNEPNHRNLWGGKPSSAEYLRLAKAAKSEIKRRVPEATVIGPALAGLDLTYLRDIVDFENGTLFETITVHPYRLPRHAPETVSNDYRRIREIISNNKKRDFEIEIAAGEWGYSNFKGGVSEQEQADFAVRMFLINNYENILFTVWYDWRDNGTNLDEREHNFGLVRRNGDKKPAYQAVKILNHNLRQTKLVSRVDFEDQEVFVFRYDSVFDTKRTVYALWALKKKTISISDLCQNAIVLDLKGSSSKIGCSRNSLVLNTSPVLLEVK